jgi:hypothetical protein
MGKALATRGGHELTRGIEAESGTHRISQRPTMPVDLRQYARSMVEAEMTIDELAVVDRASVPRVALLRDELAHLELDHRAGFLLSLVDGVSTVDSILDISGMAEDEAIVTLYELYTRGAILFG